MSSFPTPPYNPNIPIVTSEGGTTVAYRDPNSPESLMKRVALLNAQATVDRKFDSTTPTHEPFQMYDPTPSYIYRSIIFLCILFFLFVKMKRTSSKPMLIVLAILIVVLFIYSRK
jgi:hypothetical protein